MLPVKIPRVRRQSVASTSTSPRTRAPLAWVDQLSLKVMMRRETTRRARALRTNGSRPTRASRVTRVRRTLQEIRYPGLTLRAPKW